MIVHRWSIFGQTCPTHRTQSGRTMDLSAAHAHHYILSNVSKHEKGSLFNCKMWKGLHINSVMDPSKKKIKKVDLMDFVQSQMHFIALHINHPRNFEASNSKFNKNNKSQILVWRLKRRGWPRSLRNDFWRVKKNLDSDCQLFITHPFKVWASNRNCSEIMQMN